MTNGWFATEDEPTVQCLFQSNVNTLFVTLEVQYPSHDSHANFHDTKEPSLSFLSSGNEGTGEKRKERGSSVFFFHAVSQCKPYVLE